MDSSEATKMVFSRIQALDAENASKIIGYVLIQDHGEQEMIRLAFGPDHLLHSLILNAKSHLGLSANNSSAPSALPSFAPISIPTARTTRINTFPSLSPSSSPQWHNASSLFIPNNTAPPTSPSYAAVVNGSLSASNTISCSSTSPSSVQDDIFDNKLDFFNGYGISTTNTPIWRASSEPINGGTQNCHFHRRSLSLSDACFPHPRFAAAPHHLRHGVSFPFSKCANFDTQRGFPSRSAAAALMMGDEFHTFGRFRGERFDFSSAMALAGSVNPGSRQIYLTFPADSTFKEEDVSNYFSFYGPVQDVRIPYQQKRMFGFVTFVYAETVQRILSKGNPHFVCDSRVLVKPYKEKGKIPDKKQQQHLERGDYSASGFDCSRVFYNTQEMIRRKLEDQGDLQQQAIELQRKRLMNLDFLDFKNHYPYHHVLGSPIPSPTYPQTQTHQNSIFSPDPQQQQQSSREKCETPACGVNPLEVNGSSEEESFKAEDCGENLNESNLPESLFGSPKKFGDDDKLSAFTELQEGPYSDSTTTTLLSPSSTLTMATKTTPCSFLLHRFPSEIEM